MFRLIAELYLARIKVQPQEKEKIRHRRIDRTTRWKKEQINSETSLLPQTSSKSVLSRSLSRIALPHEQCLPGAQILNESGHSNVRNGRVKEEEEEEQRIDLLEKDRLGYHLR
jgi:hypothetical protein